MMKSLILIILLMDFVNNQNGIEISPDLLDKFVHQTQCFPSLGCFPTGSPFFDLKTRPISVAPHIPTTTYELFTRGNPYDFYDLKLDEDSIRNSPFNNEVPTKIIVHGYMGGMSMQDLVTEKLRKALIEHGDYNVIVVDWARKRTTTFFQAVANTRTVGAEIGLLIELLIEYKNIKPESVHLMGHSLGAHAAGYAGKRVLGLGRITGLDAGGPYFYNVDPVVRLDSSDALFVDVIHTDDAESMPKGFGLPEAIGHMDFYMNGGSHQPGCTPSVSTDESEVVPRFCNHFRAVHYFLESITTKNCSFIGVQCDSYEDYLEDECDSVDVMISEMGIDSVPIPDLKPPAKFYLKTNEKSPFCLSS